MTTQTEALKLALEGVEIHSPNSPEYIVCDALIQALAQTKHNPVGFYDAENKDLRREIPMGEDGDWWQPVYTHPPAPTAQPEQETVAIMREMLEVQGQHGNWNYDSYMHGLYNGMEYMVALAEKREPKFRDAPDEWLAKYEVKRDNFNSTEPLTEATPPQRKPLTFDQVDRACDVANREAKYPSREWIECFARAIERAHGIYPENSDCHGPDWTTRDGEYLK